MGHLPVNNEFDMALGPCQNHYSPVNEEGVTKRGGSKKVLETAVFLDSEAYRKFSRYLVSVNCEGWQQIATLFNGCYIGNCLCKMHSTITTISPDHTVG